MARGGDIKRAIKNALGDIRVELGDEFDRNFERQAYFSQAWARRRSPLRPGRSTLVDTGQLRRSVKSRVTADSVTFYTDLPYAAIHNDGGEIVVTKRMKGFFWHKYREAVGSFGRKKNGERRDDKRNRRLSTEADFWRAMALKPVGGVIRLPRRRFLGAGPEVERIVREIVEENLGENLEGMDLNVKRK